MVIFFYIRFYKNHFVFLRFRFDTNLLKITHQYSFKTSTYAQKIRSRTG